MDDDDGREKALSFDRCNLHVKLTNMVIYNNIYYITSKN